MDHVDELLSQWARTRPELDVDGLAVAARVLRLQRYLDRGTEEVVADHGLTIGESNVLAALRRAGPGESLTPTELYRSLLLSSAAMSHRLDRLEHRGLVERVRADQDRRQVLVHLTDQGQVLIDTVMDAYTARLNELLGALGAERRAELVRGMQLVLSDLESRATTG